MSELTSGYLQDFRRFHQHQTCHKLGSGTWSNNNNKFILDSFWVFYTNNINLKKNDRYKNMVQQWYVHLMINLLPQLTFNVQPQRN